MRIKRKKEAESENNILLTKNIVSILNNAGLVVFSEDADMTEFNNSCEEFKLVCSKIGEFIGKEFKGGFNEIEEFKKMEIFNTLEGLSLFASWSSANDSCIYQGKKIGLGSPAWFKRCWGEQK